MKKRSVTLNGHRTSLLLEPIFWEVLEAIAAHNEQSLARLIQDIDAARTPLAERQAGHDRAASMPNLASALRVHVVMWLKSRSHGEMIVPALNN
ncbi:MAG: ribbon-helix-helix domain-containing protein [Pseudomonadota bacterium]